MSASFTVRPDEAMDEALAYLLGDGGTSRNEVIKQAVVAYARQRKTESLRREAARLAANPADLAEARQVLTEMEALRAW